MDAMQAAKLDTGARVQGADARLPAIGLQVTLGTLTTMLSAITVGREVRDSSVLWLVQRMTGFADIDCHGGTRYVRRFGECRLSGRAELALWSFVRWPGDACGIVFGARKRDR